MFLFYLINRLYWFRWRNFYKKDEYILVEYTNNQFMNFAIVLLAKIVSVSLNARLVIFITPAISKPDKISRLIYKSLGVKFEFYLYDYIAIHGRFVLDEFRTSKSKIKTIDDLYNFSYNDVYVGDLLYDMVLRSGIQKATIKKIDSDLDDQLYALIASICFLEHLLKSKKIVYSVFSHSTMLSGVIQRYLLKGHNICGVIGSIHTSIRKIDCLHEGRNPYPAFVK